MAAERITIDISILQGIFGDLQKLQSQLAGVAGGAVSVDGATSQAFGDMQDGLRGVLGGLNGVEAGFDATMRGVVGDLMQPIARTQELNDKLARLGQEVRTSKSVGEIVKLKKEIAATQQELDRVNTGTMESKVSAGTGRMRSMFRSLAAPIAGAFAVGGITNFIGGVAKAAGETQAFEGSLQALLQSKEKADALGAQVKEFAAQTPFSGSEVRQATAQFIGFGFEANEVIGTLGHLGDVAAGLKLPFGDLAAIYGRLKEGNRLDSRSLMSFQMKGIPVVRELAKVLGVSKDKVSELVGEGKVGFGALEEAFANMTKEGGVFHGMLAASSNSITGQLSNLEDDWEQFKSHVGETFAPVISNSLGLVSEGIEKLKVGFDWLVANGSTVKKVMLGVGVAAGIYAGVLAINNAALLYNNTLQAIAAVRIGAVAIAQSVATAATNVWAGAQWLLNAALTANPIGVVIMAIAALVGGIIWAWNSSERFRGVVLGLWEVLKRTFNWVAEFLSPVIDAIALSFRILWIGMKEAWAMLGEGLSAVGDFIGQAWAWIVGFKDRVVSAFSGLVDFLLAPFRKALEALSMIPGVDKLLAKVKAVGGKVGAAFGEGQEKGIAAFRAGKSDKGTAKAGVDAYSAVAALPTGQDLGASGLVGGQPKADGSGVTVGGEKGSGRVITMNIEMKNSFELPKDANMGAREVAERVIGQLVAKLNDAQFAMG